MLVPGTLANPGLDSDEDMLHIWIPNIKFVAQLSLMTTGVLFSISKILVRTIVLVTMFLQKDNTTQR